MEENNQAKEDRREARRKRRIRNQIVAYITVILLILAVGTGIVWGVNKLTVERRDAEQESQASQDALDQMLASEDAIETPSPTPEPVVELTPEQKLDEIVNAGIEVMPLEARVAGSFCPGCDHGRVDGCPGGGRDKGGPGPVSGRGDYLF